MTDERGERSAGLEEARLTQVDALSDVQQLVRLLAESHPDPYSRVGGPIAFHRKADGVLTAIPESGVSVDELLRLLRSLTASVHDGHTFLFPPGSEPGVETAVTHQSIPVQLDPIEEGLMIGAVYNSEHRDLLGTRVEAIGGVPLCDLSHRMEEMRGADNVYSNLVHLAEALTRSDLLADLLRAEEAVNEIELSLVGPDGRARSVCLSAVEGELGDPIEPPSTIDLPPLTASDVGWGFLREDRSVACLRIASLVRYREAFEINRNTGHGRFLETYLAEAASAAVEGIPPTDMDEAIAAIPSAAEQLSELFEAMRAARTETLIVDLRDNGGGNSFFASILAYFLYGIDGLLDHDWGYQVPRYSPLYRANYLHPPEDRLLSIEAGMLNGGYDFAEEQEWERRRREGLRGSERERACWELKQQIALAPSFARIFENGHGAVWTPRLVALTSARTYSAGFDVAAMLVKEAAQLIGVPSSQAGNCFIDGLFFTLDHSQLTGIISYKWSLLFPCEPERGKVLRPDSELTYDYLASVAFDPNAAVRLALERVDA